MELLYRGVHYAVGLREPQIRQAGATGRYRGLPIQLCRTATPVDNQHLALVYRGIRYEN